MKKKNRNILVIVAIFLIVIIILSVSGLKFPFSIAPSYDIASWSVSYDLASSTNECKNLDAEFELVTDNLIPQSDGKVILTRQPIKTICGQIGGIYDKFTNSLYSGVQYKNDKILVAEFTSKPLINPPYLSFKPIEDTKVIAMTDMGHCDVPYYYPVCCGLFGSGCAYGWKNDLWLAEYDINYIMEGDQVIDATYTFTGRADKCTLTEKYTSFDFKYLVKSCTFGGEKVLSKDKIYFLRGCEPTLENDCDDSIKNTYTGNTVSFKKAISSFNLVKSQSFTDIFKISYTAPRETIPTDLHYRKYSCPLLQNYMLVTETFDANSIVTKDSFRYAPNYFCSRHPVIITDAITGKTDININWYQDIVSGKSVTCPVGDTCTFFYVVTNRLELPVICETGSYDATTGKCVAKPGIVHVCSEGQFDPSTGLCVVQPDSSIVCEIGRYDVAQGKCIWNPPEAIICPVGEYSPIEQACIVYPEQKMVCPPDYEYKNGLCMFYPAEHIVCDRGTYEVGLNACVYNPDFLAKCSIGTYDSATDKCIYTPETEYQCEKGTFDTVTRKCVFNPDITAGCIQGQYDPVRNACVVTPDLSYLCLNGYYNEELEVCVIFPIERIYCNEGFVYDSVTDLCVKSPSESIDCPSNYLYDPVRDLCYFTPQTGIRCPDGTTYNRAQDRCEYEPQVGVVCPASTVYDSMEDKCVIHPENRIICNDGYIYDFSLDACVKRPAIISWWYKFIEWLNNLFK